MGTRHVSIADQLTVQKQGPVRTDRTMPSTEPKLYPLDSFTMSEVVRIRLKDLGITNYAAAHRLEGLKLASPSTVSRFLSDRSDTLCSRVEDILAACGLALVQTDKRPELKTGK